MSAACLRCRVRGRVQGVGFRAATQAKARELKLRGYVRNCEDGSVETLVCGAPAQVEALRAWLWAGPAWAKPEDVNCEAVDEDAPADFRIA